MTVQTPTQVPRQLIAGDTWAWERSLADYPAGTYTAVWYFEGAAGSFSVTAGVNGAAHTGSVSAAASAAYGPGRYKWSLVATKVADSTRTTAEDGRVEIVMDPAAAGRADRRTHARKVLDAIEAVIEGRASQDQQSYALSGRSLSRTPIPELLVLRDRYKAEVKREERAERIASGLPAGGRVMVRF